MRAAHRKGSGLTFPHRDMAVDGNVHESSHAGGCPRKSFLFFLTVPPTLESDHPEIGCSHWESSARLAESGAHSTALETLEERAF
jgi:hypothetical protein